MSIKVGDYVTIGKNRLTWKVESIENSHATLTSGQSGRRRVEPLYNLTLFMQAKPTLTVIDSWWDRWWKFWHRRTRARDLRLHLAGAL